MSLSMYQATVPVLLRQLGNLRHVLTLAAQHADKQRIDPAIFLSSRLFPDMFALTRQVQIACDTAKGAAYRLAGQEPPRFEDNETTFAQLEARIERTIEAVSAVTAAQIDGSEKREIMLKVGPNTLTFTGQDYLLHFVLPNLFFHVTTTYAILRHHGVPLGKKDFLGAL
jgi:hypothetical protein